MNQWLDYWLPRLEGRQAPATPWERLLLAGMTPLGQIHSTIQQVRATGYRRGWWSSAPADCPVISVGNLAVGGTGKTPAVYWLARYLVSCGLRVAIVSRGYRQQSAVHDVTVVADPDGIRLTPPMAADEACMLARRLPGVSVLTGANRRQVIAHAVQTFGVQIAVLDDGFQHMAVARDLDLVLLDAHTPLGNGAVFPAGILREPVTALQRADLVLFTRSTTEQASAPPRLPAGVMPPVPWLFAHHQPTGWIHADGSMQPLDQIHDTPVLACCGIARPHTFRETLATLGVSVAGWATFPDHHPYTNDDLRHLRQQALACGARALVCTEKDWVKLTRFPPVLPIHALGIELMFHTPPTALYTAVDRLVAEIKTGSRSRMT